MLKKLLLKFLGTGNLMKGYIYLRRIYCGLHDRPLTTRQKSQLVALAGRFLHGTFDFIDVGARGGKLKNHWLAFDWEKIRTIAIEPDSSSVSHLSSLNQYDVIIQKAVGQCQEVRTLHLTQFSGCSSVVAPMKDRLELFPAALWFQIIESQVVEISKLDDVIFGTNKTWLKIDVQGFEPEVLKGATKLLNNVLMVDIEFQFYPIYDATPLESLQLLAKLDFIPVQIRSDKFWWGGFLPEANAVYIKNPLTLSINDLMLCLILLSSYGERLAVLHIIRKRERELPGEFIIKLKSILGIRSDWTFPAVR